MGSTGKNRSTLSAAQNRYDGAIRRSIHERDRHRIDAGKLKDWQERNR